MAVDNIARGMAAAAMAGGGGTGGGGDMQKSVYDPAGEVAAAGGIPAYVSNAIQTAVTGAMEASY